MRAGACGKEAGRGMKQRVMDEYRAERSVALVTGGSRGLGAATAEAAAHSGFDVLFTYYNKAARASDVIMRIHEAGNRATAFASDMTNPAERQRLLRELEWWGNGRLDLLVLNAAGGLERDRLEADPHYARRINCDAQVALVELALPLMPAGSAIVFVTSHWSHLYGQIQQLSWYETVAATKYAGEMALRAMQPSLDAAGVRLLVASGDIITGTIMANLLARRAPGLIERREVLVGPLPTTADAAEAIVRAVSDLSLPSGDTLVIGGSLQSVMDTFGRPE